MMTDPDLYEDPYGYGDVVRNHSPEVEIETLLERVEEIETLLERIEELEHQLKHSVPQQYYRKIVVPRGEEDVVQYVSGSNERKGVDERRDYSGHAMAKTRRENDSEKLLCEHNAINSDIPNSDESRGCDVGACPHSNSGHI